MKSRLDAFLIGIAVIGALVGLFLWIRPDMAMQAEPERLIYLVLVLAFLTTGGYWWFRRGFAIGSALIWAAIIVAVTLAYQYFQLS